MAVRLANRMGAVVPSAIIEIAGKARDLKAAGKDVVSLSIGVPGFTPPAHVYAAAKAAVDADSGDYLPGRGSKPLVEAFVAGMAARGFAYGPTEVCAQVGGKGALFNLMLALVDEGDEVVIPAPYWASYPDMVKLAGGVPVTPLATAEQNYKLTPQQLEDSLTDKTKVLIFNNPSNPTGMLYTAEEIKALGDVLAKYPDVWIISDDIYDQLVFEHGVEPGGRAAQLLDSHPDLRGRLVIVQSVSKTYGMPGWRVGFIAGPESVAKAVTTLNSNHITSLPEVITAAAVAALTGPQDIPAAKCAEFAGKRDTVMAALNAIPGVICPRPQGAFYAFPDISVAFGKHHGGQLIENDVQFCAALLDSKAVACVPGSAFGEPHAMRISYTCPTPQLAPGLERIAQFFTELT